MRENITTNLTDEATATFTIPVSTEVRA